MRIMHIDEGEKLVNECLPHTTRIKYRFRPNECTRMWIFTDGLVIIISKNSLSTDYVVGSNPDSGRKLSIFHDVQHDDEYSRSALAERIKTFLIYTILRQ